MFATEVTNIETTELDWVYSVKTALEKKPKHEIQLVKFSFV